MSVFLRWGIFGILGVAGLMYAYNASKQLAEKRSARNEAGTTEMAQPAGPESVALAAPAVAVPAAEPLCEEELLVAERALEARADDVPLDRLLRIQEIAFQEPPRRARLEKVAVAWFNLNGTELDADALRVAVVGDCVKARTPDRRVIPAP